MKKIRDRFSGHSKVYQKFRPLYPDGIYDCILSHVKNRDSCWDCATGNGQVARVLASYFKTVNATDISANQLRQAPVISNVIYGQQRAESSNFPDHSFDLITVGQAIHWFDIPAFLKEVKRVGRPGAALAVWGYGLLQLGPPLDRKISHFYREVVGPYWDGERKHIDSAYTSIPLPLKDLSDLSGFQITKPMDFAALSGYLSSWSSVQNYISKNGNNPVDELMATLKPHWPEGQTREAVFPIFGSVGTLND